mmetsp:Transcript_29244/g.35534  ORF Transcript_29244/g.35534 Transcript_29244/m.35534 type:complete len:212 (-) Transcript_29244:352-987(-)
MGKKSKGKTTKALPRAKFFDSDGGVSTEFDNVLEDIFGRFDADADGALSPEELNAFARACNEGDPFSEEEMEEISTYFDVDSRNFLTLKGFKEMMITQSGGRPKDTWRDLERLGYDQTLQVPEKATEETSETTSSPSEPQASSEKKVPAKSVEQLGKEQLSKFLADVKAARSSGDPAEISRVTELLKGCQQSEHPLVERLLSELTLETKTS